MDLRLLRYFVVVVDERHMGRAAARLHMTQPPLSRAIKRLEADFGVSLLDRTSTGVSPTPDGTVLYDQAKSLLEHADEVDARMARAIGTPTLRLGTLADSAVRTGAELASAFRSQMPGVPVPLFEADFTDPTAGLRSGRSDVAITRTPFDTTGLGTQLLRTDPVGVVLRSDDPMAARPSVILADLADRPWFRFPDGTDPLWQTYWSGLAAEPRRGPLVRTVNECMQAVLWNGSIGISPLDHELPEGLHAVPIHDMPPSSLILAWRCGDANPLIRRFAQVAAEVFPRRPLKTVGTSPDSGRP